MTPFTDEQAREAFLRHSGAYPESIVGDLTVGRALLTLEAERDEKAAWWAASADRAKALEARVRELERFHTEDAIHKDELTQERDTARREVAALRPLVEAATALRHQCDMPVETYRRLGGNFGDSVCLPLICDVLAAAPGEVKP